ncbi:hypothetical protein B446_02095 [Streptomyces collinus Tu 365]|uniref:Uncharacterized protein n=1 Tax=Streptomyces collinus (strain DSM 40733 / Tue 365) TaxID=1214242 RepID=S5UN90_STRC3|nr:hypothetical protein B446_02095 [Streptomyces collinus Tu 365]
MVRPPACTAWGSPAAHRRAGERTLFTSLLGAVGTASASLVSLTCDGTLGTVSTVDPMARVPARAVAVTAAVAAP